MKRFASDRVTGLMERLGLEEDVAIESKLVSRTIESAQSRVEGFNFDIRKRVVEFDDVINKQRETIYAERDKVLHNEDLTETVRRFLDDEIDVLVGDHLAGEDPEAWNLDALAASLSAMGLAATRRRPTRSGTRAGGRPSPTTCASSRTPGWTLAKPRSARRTGAQVERIVLVRTIDSLWVEHLTELDDMRRGIGLRGYAQQDPLNEFRREAFRMYEEFRDMIRHGVASSIFRVTVQKQPPPGGDGAVAQALARGAEALRSGSGNGAGAGAGAAQPVAAGATVAGSAVLRGSLPKAPAVRNVTASLGGEPVTDGASVGACRRDGSGRSTTRLHPDR